MKKSIFFILILLPCFLMAQDYEMWETTYLKPKPGHYAQLMEKLADHNHKYHKEGASSAYVFFVTNGPRSNQLAWVMGPCTFTDLDNRDGGDEHFIDWFDGVMSHCDNSERGTEYWVRNDALSHMPETDGEPRPLQRLRIFEVVDNDLFVEVQSMVKEVIEKTPEFEDTPRVMYRRQFANPDNRHWAIVSSYKNWATFDEDNPPFKAAFEKVHGEAAWEPFTEKAEKAILSREDELRQAMDELHGPQPEAGSGN